MPMRTPAFTTNPMRVARLQENYDAGVEREKLPAAEREKLDYLALTVSDEKLRFLFQNALESYSAEVKNKKAQQYNENYPAAGRKKWLGVL
ncbi:hypothetical protein LSM04_007209 [Trypanosoma melophagium]|uniref:uncharacterized protein n=1 Tax=Trypanosoma melophagium TaxID=715481 RepID=UPI00351A0875|nr:hypothetical protein LSM04_007209 [Trypanosoma melophagium]